MGRTQGSQNVDVNESVAAVLDGTCTEELTHALYGLGPEPVTLALMAVTRQVCFTAWLHYGLGVTIVHILAIVGHHLHTVLSAGALIGQCQRLGEILSAWYEQIGEEAKHSAMLHADETGWRVSGRTHWMDVPYDNNVGERRPNRRAK